MPAPTPDAVLAVTADRLREAAVPSPAADARLLLAHAWDCTPGELGLRSLRGTAVPEPVRAVSYTHLRAHETKANLG